MRVLSLFDGISCGQLALQKLGIEVEKYYASEIDTFAIAITKYNFPETIQLGDVNNWKNWDIEWDKIDLLIGGSPCQNLSNAGNGTGLQGTESSLFYRFLEILNHLKSINPNVKFLLENVKMKGEWEEEFNKCLGCKPILIDSALVSAQRRRRLYWTNIPVDPNIEDKNLFLRDIVEPEENKAMYDITDRMYAKKEGTLAFKKAWSSVKTLDEKSRTLTCSQCIANSGATNISYPNGKYYKPSPIESERLQTLPDNYTKFGVLNNKVQEMSYAQRIKTVGNGWTADVIAHIFKGMK